MSYLLGNRNNPSFNHPEWELWRENYLQNFAQFNEIYKGVDIAFEIDNDIKYCAYCGNQDHICNMIKCLDKQYRHECCIEFLETYQYKNHENK